MLIGSASDSRYGSTCPQWNPWRSSWYTYGSEASVMHSALSVVRIQERLFSCSLAPPRKTLSASAWYATKKPAIDVTNVRATASVHTGDASAAAKTLSHMFTRRATRQENTGGREKLRNCVRHGR